MSSFSPPLLNSSLQLEEELERGVSDSLEDDSWALLCSATNGNNFATKHKETRSLFLKTDVHKILLVLIWENIKIHSALWHALRSWFLVIFAKFQRSMPQEIVRTVATSAWPHCVPGTLFFDTLFIQFPLQPTEDRRLDVRCGNLLMDHCQHVTRVLWQRQHQGTKDVQNDKSRSSATFSSFFFLSSLFLHFFLLSSLGPPSLPPPPDHPSPDRPKFRSFFPFPPQFSFFLLGGLEQVRFYPFQKFWPFLGLPVFSVVLPHMTICLVLGALSFDCKKCQEQ